MPNLSIVWYVFGAFSVDEEVGLILCTLLSWLLYSWLGGLAETRRGSCPKSSSVEAKLLLAGDLSDVSCQDEKLKRGRLVPMLRRSILQTVMRRCSMRTRKNLKSWRRVSFCEEVSYRALEPRELSLRQALQLKQQQQQQQEEDMQLEETTAASCGSSPWSGKGGEVTEADYKAMVHAAIRAGF